MFWDRNKRGLAIVALAVALIAGEVMGFVTSACAEFWPWAACLSILTVCVFVGWSLPFGRYFVLMLLGVMLAWRMEAARLDVEMKSHRLGADGLPPAFDVKVESDVAKRRYRRRDRWIVNFNSHIEGMPVKVVAPVIREGDVPKPGETWRCAGWLSLKKSAHSRYARRKLWVMHEDHMHRIAAADRQMMPSIIYSRMSDVLSRLAGIGLGWCPDLASFNRAMLLGRRTDAMFEKRDVFATAGTMHVFAISGLHVMLVAGFLKTLLSKAGLPSRACAACTIPLLAAYVMLSGARPSAVRAAIMMSLWLGASLFGRKPDMLAALGNTALVVYGTSPALIFDTGCALSFVVMLGIVLWIRWSSQFATPLDWMRRIAAREQSLGDNRRAVVLLTWHRRGLMVLGALGISCAAWIAGAPIAARIFGRITLGSLVANVFVVPIAGGAVILGAMGIAASMVSAPLGAVLNNLSALCTWFMECISEMVASLPGLAFETLPWSWRDCLLWYLAWILLFWLLARHLPPREFISVTSWNGGGEPADGDEHGKTE